MNKPLGENPDKKIAPALAEVNTLVAGLKQPFPGASVSIKNQRVDPFGESQLALTVATDNSVSTCWLVSVQRGLKASTLSAKDELFILSTSLVDAEQPELPVETYLHAALPANAVIFYASEAILSLCSAQNSQKLLAEGFAGSIVQADFAESIREQAKLAASAWTDGAWAILLPHRGLLVVGASVSQAAERLNQIQQKAEVTLKSRNAWNTTVTAAAPASIDLNLAAEIRKQISQQAGTPLIIRWAALAGWDPTPIENHSLMQSLPYVQASRMVMNDSLGVGFIGEDAEEAAFAQGSYEMEQRIAQRAARLGKIAWLENPATITRTPKDGIMRGEIALVTGAASGIGKACVFSFLARGAAVVGLDVNPAVVSILDRPDYLGIACDLTNEDAIRSALARAAQTFGGLDMMVLNAGIFPSSKRIEVLACADFERVLRINLTANLNLMREAHPLLKNAPRYGRVAITASRNALAPGPGAAAYSVSKMALTQLARVAALEWGGEGIRVNMVHPDAVFDTGVWSEEVLKARAQNYHMTVDEYKRRNVLKTELSSKDVSEMIVEMCGPLFSKITGAQLPVDGGSDRVI